MRGRFLFLVIVSFFIWSCEDPTTLPISKVFSGNKLQTVFVDTFSVITSTVQLDSVLTNGSGTVLIGRYKDQDLGIVSSSSYFLVGYTGAFKPETYAVFDSAALILPYNHSYSGDTTQAVNLSVYELTEQMVVRTLPSIRDLKLSVFNTGNGFFNTSKIKYSPSPIVSQTIKFTPHANQVSIRIPDAFASNWFRLAKTDSGKLFSSVNNFVTNYFHGMHLEIDPSTDACVVGFKTSDIKIRFYYKNLSGDILQQTHFDFTVYSPPYQFNHIDYDRSGTSLAGIQKLQAFPTKLTGNKSYVQSGTGLVTRLDFPSLKNFFRINNGIILNAVYLEVHPVIGTYPKNLLPPSSLQLYATDGSNMPLGTISSTASIQYDYEFGLNTVYRYQLFPYFFGQLQANNDFVTPLIIAPIGSQGSSIQRVYIGDRFSPYNKIKLNIYYSYSPN